jgi:pSer/pThr/pTyr-binding forkhead associated (FHA) protein
MGMRRQQIRLEHLSGPEDGKIVGFSQEAITIGHEQGCDLVLAHDPTVSRRHAQVLREGEQLLVEDFGSTHGTFVNGERVNGRVELPPGAILRLGNSYFAIV